ncbi:MAG TPA: matrixin family metalloprotease [Bryobacteraceae bacterium]|nr:matrixin family metalloprotease [Bryobacteraceae bacterium]
MSLAVRISTSDAALAQQFRKAMDFWSGVLDLDWHEVSSEDCAMQLVDGTPALFDFCKCLSARSHLPDRPEFQGWIAFNPLMTLTEREMYMVSVHEIGHVLGLPHNPHASSVMFYLELDKPASLDATDLEALALRHQLRGDIAEPKRGSRDIRIPLPNQFSSRKAARLSRPPRRMIHRATV